MAYGLDPTLQTSERGGGIDSATGSTMGELMAKNSTNQAYQEQLVQQAIEKTKQARIGTQVEQAEFDAQTYLSRQGLMPKAQALAQLHIVLMKQDVADDKVAKIMEAAQNELPAVMDGRSLYQWWTALEEKFESKPTAPHMATQQDVDNGQIDSNNNPVVKDQSYLVYPSGKWVPSGKSAAELALLAKQQADAAKVHTAAAAKTPTVGPGSRLDQTQWYALVKEMDPTGASYRNALGQAYSGIVAAVRGEFLLSQEKVTHQNMQEVTRDLTRIIQQGVPTDAGSEGMTYHTLMGDIQKKLQYLTGEAKNAIPDNLKLYLKDSFERLHAIAMDTIESKIQQKEAGLPDLIASHRDSWDNLTFRLRHPPQTHKQEYADQVDAAKSTSTTTVPPPAVPATAPGGLDPAKKARLEELRAKRAAGTLK